MRAFSSRPAALEADSGAFTEPRAAGPFRWFDVENVIYISKEIFARPDNADT